MAEQLEFAGESIHMQNLIRRFRDTMANIAVVNGVLSAINQTDPSDTVGVQMNNVLLLLSVQNRAILLSNYVGCQQFDAILTMRLALHQSGNDTETSTGSNQSQIIVQSETGSALAESPEGRMDAEFGSGADSDSDMNAALAESLDQPQGALRFNPFELDPLIGGGPVLGRRGRDPSGAGAASPAAGRRRGNESPLRMGSVAPIVTLDTELLVRRANGVPMTATERRALDTVFGRCRPNRPDEPTTLVQLRRHAASVVDGEAILERVLNRVMALEGRSSIALPNGPFFLPSEERANAGQMRAARKGECAAGCGDGFGNAFSLETGRAFDLNCGGGHQLHEVCLRSLVPDDKGKAACPACRRPVTNPRPIGECVQPPCRGPGAAAVWRPVAGGIGGQWCCEHIPS